MIGSDVLIECLLCGNKYDILCEGYYSKTTWLMLEYLNAMFIVNWT